MKKGLLDLMKTTFPENQYTYYSAAVVEGYKRPSFFTQLKPSDTGEMNRNSRKITATFYIDYMQKVKDEAECLRVIQTLIDLFGLGFYVGNRFVRATNYDWDFIGQERNIPEISIDLEWNVAIQHNTENVPLMQEAEIKQKLED